MTDPLAAQDSGVRVVVAGTGGGVGVTTVAALLFEGMRSRPLGAPQLLDHAGGDVGTRLPSGDEVARIDPLVRLQDAGRHAARIALDVLARPHDLLVIVAPRTPLGLADARALLTEVDGSTGLQGRRRTVLALDAPFGPVRDADELESLRSDFERRSVHAIPTDPALAVGGRIAMPRLARPTRRAAHDLAAHVADLVSRHRAGVGG
ncbi:hypothetical protein [Amnibacterium kyonggiense]|uniref:MinD-like ATPase involved in chromosome partitioning or flagellar assembly n=1 Tax=Amnibacterium kyonggiense TaxID=595671 RepID=A0A4R7FSM9_9MICO|nr:hypothetical protein [Amnibacterium kyonggiense]TDS80840.1 hypothetical protein CLV52_1410 [Amnibacterium kyonggiense]